MDLMKEQRLARRAAILAAARQMIAQHGYEAVKVRDLADICRVSVPTLYNQFGGKDQLLAAAIEEHFVLTLGSASIHQSAPGYDRLLSLIDQCALQLVKVPGYHQRLLEAFSCLASTLKVQERIASNLAAAIAIELRTMVDKRQLVGWAVPEPLAKQMTTACIGTAFQWSAGIVSDALLGAQMHYAMGLVLLGVTRGVAHAQMEARIQSAQQQIERAPPPTLLPKPNKTGVN